MVESLGNGLKVTDPRREVLAGQLPATHVLTADQTRDAMCPVTVCKAEESLPASAQADSHLRISALRSKPAFSGVRHGEKEKSSGLWLQPCSNSSARNGQQRGLYDTLDLYKSVCTAAEWD